MKGHYARITDVDSSTGTLTIEPPSAVRKRDRAIWREGFVAGLALAAAIVYGVSLFGCAGAQKAPPLALTLAGTAPEGTEIVCLCYDLSAPETCACAAKGDEAGNPGVVTCTKGDCPWDGPAVTIREDPIAVSK